MSTLPPDSFEIFPEDQTFNDALKPLYFQFTEQQTRWGLLLEKKHCNPIGICHGGVYMTLMDFALSSAICHAVEKFMGMPTISMSFDFMASAKEGDWIVSEVEPLKITNTMGFAQGKIINQQGDVLLRASGSYKLPKNLETAEGISLKDVLAMKG